MLFVQLPAPLAAETFLTPSVVWTTTGGFESPESATISSRYKAIFVSNVNGYEKNGQGFISQLSLEGAIEQLVWLDGINAPTGLKADGDTLWAVDFDRLLEIDIPSAHIRAAYPAPDANPLLNDVAIGPEGAVFVTGSNSNSVYQLVEGNLVVWLRDDEALQYANGVMVTEDTLLVAANHLIQIGRQDKDLRPFGPKTLLYDLESVMPDGRNGHLVSVIGDRPLYQLTASGMVGPIYKPPAYLADFDVLDGLLVGPTGPDSVTAIRLK